MELKNRIENLENDKPSQEELEERAIQAQIILWKICGDGGEMPPLQTAAEFDKSWRETLELVYAEKPQPEAPEQNTGAKPSGKKSNRNAKENK